MEVEERRCRKILYYSGRAFILFGIWSGVKIFFQLYLDPIDWMGLMDAALTEPDTMDMKNYEHLIQPFFYGIIGTFLAIDILFRLYIGSSAIKEGNGKKKRITYIIFAILYLTLTLLSYIPSFADLNENGGEVITSLFFDISSSIALVAIIINAWKLRKLV